MTPSAVTPAARRASAAGERNVKQPPARPSTRAPAGRNAAGARTSGHPGSVNRPSAPRAPRRVSGPVSGLIRGRVITRPQREGGEAPAVAPRARPRTARRGPLAARAFSYFGALPDHSLLDRIVRGRAWIPLLGVLLAGIVAMQVEVLKLGASIGRSIERGTALQSRNEILRANVASLADDARIEQLAAGMGMVMPAPAEVKFLAARGGNDVQRAIDNIHAPDATAFAAQLQAANLASGATASGVSMTATLGTAAALPASTTAAQTTPSSGSSVGITPSTSSTPIAPAQTPTTAGQGPGSTPTGTPAATPTGTPASTPTGTPTGTPASTPATTSQTGAAATPIGAGAGSTGQTGSSGGAATPTGG
jgi:hypothetical protein